MIEKCGDLGTGASLTPTCCVTPAGHFTSLVLRTLVSEIRRVNKILKVLAQ